MVTLHINVSTIAVYKHPRLHTDPFHAVQTRNKRKYSLGFVNCLFFVLLSFARGILDIDMNEINHELFQNEDMFTNVGGICHYDKVTFLMFAIFRGRTQRAFH